MTLNGTVFVNVAHRSDQEHEQPITWDGQPIPHMHLNPRSAKTTLEEVMEIYIEEVSR